MLNSLEDLLQEIRGDTLLNPIRRRDLGSAIKRLAELLGRNPRDVPASLEQIRSLVIALNPVNVGLAPRTLQNLKANVTAALRHMGAPSPASQALSPIWKALHGALPDMRLRNGLRRFIGYCDARGISPSEVDDAVLDAFYEYLRTETFVREPRYRHRETAQLWNRAATNVASWPKQQLKPPDYRRRGYSVPLQDFPITFQNDLKSYCAWLGRDDPFDDNAPSRPRKPSTIALRHKLLVYAASALVRSGRPIASIQGLSALLASKDVRTILYFFHERAKAKAENQCTQHLRNLGQALISVGRWEGLKHDQINVLKTMIRKLGRPETGMTPKNRALLRMFNGNAAKRRLIDLPDRIVKRILREGKLGKPIAVQLALAIAILTWAPMRIANLVALSLDEHVIRIGAGRQQQVHLSLPGWITKNGVSAEYPLVAKVVGLLDLYHTRYRPLLAQTGNPYLFPGANGRGHKRAPSLGNQITDVLEKELGFRMTPHQFRHFAAKLILDAEPGNYATVNLLLTHRSMRTTLDFYTGLELESAVRHYARTILRFTGDVTREPLFT
jgi:integrase